MGQFIIRPAQVSDAPQIGAVGYAAWLKGIGEHVAGEAHERVCADIFASFARASFDQIVVAEAHDALLGFAATEDGDNYISDLWVSPAFEGRGIGSALLSELESGIADRGYDNAEVEVLTKNERAFSLYRHLGYEIVWQRHRKDKVLRVTLHKTLLRKAILGENYRVSSKP